MVEGLRIVEIFTVDLQKQLVFERTVSFTPLFLPNNMATLMENSVMPQALTGVS